MKLTPVTPPKQRVVHRPPQTFGEQVAAQMPILNRIACKYIKDPTDREDLVGEVVVKALTNQHQFKQDTNLTAWLSTILYNTFVNQYRLARKRGPLVDISEFLYDSGITNYATTNTGPLELENQELEGRIGKLSPKLRRVVQARLEGLKYEEIAIRFQIPCGTVKNQLFLARHALSKEV